MRMTVTAEERDWILLRRAEQRAASARPKPEPRNWAWCVACYGTGRSIGNNGSQFCPACHGTGRTPADGGEGEGR